MSDVVAVVTARGGSVGIPGKNIRPLAGKPMIAWTLDVAHACTKLSRVIVSTDDPEIARIARDCGTEVPFLRPPELATATASHLSVIEHALDWLESSSRLPEYVVLLQPTSPLRLPKDVDGAIALALEKRAIAVIGVTKLDKHPFIAKKILPDGTLEDFVPNNCEDLRRQNLPPAYTINGAVYVNRSTALRSDRTFFPARAYGYVMPPSRSLDIDTPLDFFLVEQVLKHRDAFLDTDGESELKAVTGDLIGQR